MRLIEVRNGQFVNYKGKRHVVTSDRNLKQLMDGVAHEKVEVRIAPFPESTPSFVAYAPQLEVWGKPSTPTRS